jgi:hypothetical protein
MRRFTLVSVGATMSKHGSGVGLPSSQVSSSLSGSCRKESRDLNDRASFYSGKFSKQDVRRALSRAAQIRSRRRTWKGFHIGCERLPGAVLNMFNGCFVKQVCSR